MSILIHPQSRLAADRPSRRQGSAAAVRVSVPGVLPADQRGPAPRRFTAPEYFRLAETGILGPAERVELLGGTIYTMAPQGDAHIAKTNRLLDLFTRPELIGAPRRWIVQCQSTLRLGPASAPEPDLALLRPRADFYESGGRPKPADVLLVLEVADSSLGHDRTLKAAEYARAGLVEYWIVNLVERVVEVHRRPVRRSGRYREVRVAAPGETLALAACPEVMVAVADLLAPLLPPTFGPVPPRARRRRHPVNEISPARTGRAAGHQPADKLSPGPEEESGGEGRV